MALFFGLPAGFTQNEYSISDSARQQLDSAYREVLEKYKVVGASLAIVDSNGIVYAQGYGFQDREQQVPATENTIYRIGSISKSFTALSIMQLQEQGALHVGDPIGKHIPELKVHSRFDADNPLLIEDILTHTSGLPSDLWSGFFCDTPPPTDWLVGTLNNCTMAAPAGYQHSYSNAGYGLLGELVQQTTAKTYQNYLTENIFAPLNMSASYVDQPTEEQAALYSKGYLDGKAVDEGIIRDQGAGLVHSNVLDMAHYIQMYLQRGQFEGRQIVDKASMEAMERNAVGDLVLATDAQWGFGLYADSMSWKSETDTLVTRIVGHGGDTWAYHADFAYLPEMKLGAIILTNTDRGVRIASAKTVLEKYLEYEHKVRFKKHKKAVKAPVGDQIASPEQVVGEYYFQGLALKVKYTKIITFKQSGVKVILTPVNDSLVYSAKAKILGIYPVKVKNQRFRFVTKDGEVFFKVIYMHNGSEDYVARKSSSGPLNSSWSERLGSYTVVSNPYPCTDCPFMNFEGLSMKLKEVNGTLVFEMEAKTRDTRRRMFMNPINDEFCVSYGIGRGTGEAIRVLPNGNLFYSGFEFVKKS
ncbi:MAG: serine hydrolase domain-containing protein [Salibacteraceae bacterium]